MEYSYRDELYHHGIKGQKWGVRRFQNEDGTWTAAGKSRYGGEVSDAKAAYKSAKKAYNKSYNNAYWRNNPFSKKSKERWNDTFDKAQDLAKARKALKDAKNAEKDAKKAEKAEQEAKRVDVSLAKNSATRRVAEDYHNLSDREFKGKYQASKKTFAKRYEKTKGDTYSLGLKKQARAIAFLNAVQGKSMKKTASDIAKYTALSKAEQHQLDLGHDFAAKVISTATAASMQKDYGVRKRSAAGLRE